MLKNNRGVLLMVGVLVGLLMGIMLPFSQLHAVATHGSDEDGVRFMTCTAELEPGQEGIYYLDTRTGNLQSAFFNSRTQKITAAYEYNILNDFKEATAGATKATPKFLMVSGSFAFRQFAGNLRPSQGIIYVVEERSGIMCAYAAPYGPSRESAPAYKEKLVLLATYKFGSQVIRESK